MPITLGGMIIYLDGLLAIKARELLRRSLARSRDKLRPLYLEYHIAYGHQTWKDGDLPSADPTHDVT